MRTLLVTLLLFAAAASAQAQVPDFKTSWVGWDTSAGSQARWPWAARVADLNQDGRPDVAAANWWFFAKLSVVINAGDGTFGQPALYPYSKGALDLELADVTGDGVPDVIVANTGANYEGTTISRLRNLGDGTFAPHQTFACGAGPVGVAAADFDGDGRVDAAIALYGFLGNGSQVALLRNDGLGGFLAPVAFASGASPYKLAAGDLDGDGDADLAVAREDQRVSVLLNAGGAFAAPVSYSTFAFVNTDVYPGLALGDVDHDDDLDVVYGSTGLAVGTQTVTALLRNQGNGALAPAEAIVGSGGVDFALADVTGDGWLDLLAARESSDFWWLAANDGQGHFLAEQRFSAGENPIEVAAADADGDGDLDAFVVARDSLEIAVARNPGNGAFAPPPATLLANGVYGPANADLLDAGDVDQDGDLDVVAGYNVLAQTKGAVALARNDGAGGLAITTLPASTQVLAPKLGDLNGDGRLDLTWGDDYPPYNFRTRRNLGGGVFGAEVNHSVSTCGNTGLGLADVDADGDLDVCLLEGLACVNVPESNRRIFVSRNHGDATFDPPYVVISDVGVNDLEGVDLDRDGLTDLVTTQPGSLVVLRGIGGGFFAPKVSYPLGGNSLAVADFDGDANVDVAVGAPGGSGVEQRVTVRLGIGDGTLGPPISSLASFSYTFSGVTGLAAGDVDGDGSPDLMASNWGSGDVSFFRNAGAGAFAPQVRYGAWTAPSDVVFGEFDGDGRPDAVVLASPSPMSPFTLALGVLRGTTNATPSPYGAGTPGCAGAHVLAASGAAVVGDPSFALKASHAPANALGLGLVTDAPSAGSDPLGLGVTLLVDLLAATEIHALDFASDAFGIAAAPVPIPPSPALAGKTFYAQALFAWPAGACAPPPSPFGLSTSNGVQLTIQP